MSVASSIVAFVYLCFSKRHKPLFCCTYYQICNAFQS